MAADRHYTTVFSALNITVYALSFPKLAVKNPGLPTLCLKKFWKLREMPRHWRSQLGVGAFSVFVWGHRIFCKIESKVVNSRVPAGGFVMGCANIALVLSIYKKIVKKSAV